MWQPEHDMLKIWQPALAPTFWERLPGRRPLFVLTVAYTATVTLPGLSGAGTTAELRELTATADAEILAHGLARGLPGGVPSNPTGAPGPSIITRAAFDLLAPLRFLCVDAGLKASPDVPDLERLEGAAPGAAVTTGQALGSDESRARLLFEAGLRLGDELGRREAAGGYLVLAESVPGGTTTALGLLLGLGLDAEKRVSSSMPGNAHTLKLAAVEAGLAAGGFSKGTFSDQPLRAAAALGDPMQPAVAGIALAASAYCPVILAGGTQMAAVLALAAALHRHAPFFSLPASQALSSAPSAAVLSSFSNLALVTTSWVARDPTGDLAGLGREIEERFGPLPVPYLAARLNFSASRYPALRLYEQGYVKEGVGAGAAAFIAMLHKNLSAAQLLPSIEQTYRRLVLKEENIEP